MSRGEFWYRFHANHPQTPVSAVFWCNHALELVREVATHRIRMETGQPNTELLKDDAFYEACLRAQPGLDAHEPVHLVQRRAIELLVQGAVANIKEHQRWLRRDEVPLPMRYPLPNKKDKESEQLPLRSTGHSHQAFLADVRRTKRSGEDFC